jgi:hypothetical protein
MIAEEVELFTGASPPILPSSNRTHISVGNPAPPEVYTEGCALAGALKATTAVAVGLPVRSNTFCANKVTGRVKEKQMSILFLSG